MAIAPAWPDELVGCMQYPEAVVCLNPGIAFLAEHAARFPAGCIEEIEIKLVLSPIHHRGPNQIVADPPKSGYVNIFVIRQAKPMGLASIGVHYAQPHFGVWIAN